MLSVNAYTVNQLKSIVVWQKPIYSLSVNKIVCQLWDFFIGPHIRREYWCSSQEAESREISISCKNLFLNRCKINMFKLKL